MAYTDKTRFGEYAQKKSICVFAAPVKFGSANEDIAVTSDNYLMAKLPPDAVILDAYVHVVTASDAATSTALSIGTAEAGTEILSAVDLTTVGEQGMFTGQNLTGTGVDVYFGVAISGAATEVGEFIAVIEYLEYEKNTGEYTVISR